MRLWGINGRNQPEEKSNRNRRGSLVIEWFPIRRSVFLCQQKHQFLWQHAAGPAVRASAVPIIPASLGACSLLSWEPEEPRIAGTAGSHCWDCWQPSVLVLSVTSCTPWCEKTPAPSWNSADTAPDAAVPFSVCSDFACLVSSLRQDLSLSCSLG